MFSPSTIQDLQDKAARDAARRNRKPYVLWNEEEVDRIDRFPFPFIGTHRPKGWRELVTSDGIEVRNAWSGGVVDSDEPITLFVDSSGFGDDNEAALSVRQFKSVLKEVVTASGKLGKTVGFAIIEVGQFQVVLGLFIKEGK
jgi:hypothetical protein